MQKCSTDLSSTKNTLKKITLGSIFLALPFSSFGQDSYTNTISLASITDHSKGDGFVQSFGVNLDYSPAFDGSDQYGIEVQGGGALQYRKGKHLFFLEGFDIDGAELGWRAMMNKNWLVQAGVRHETVLPSGDLAEAKIEGMPHRGSTVFGFVEANYLFGKNERFWLSGRLSAGPSDFGYRAKFSVGHSFGRSADSSLDMLAYSTFGDAEQFDRYFGISAVESASSGLNQTDLDGGYRSSGVELVYRKNLLSNMQLVAKVGVEAYGSEIKKSMLVTEDVEVGGGMSIVWRFW
jgi:outer membrane protein